MVKDFIAFFIKHRSLNHLLLMLLLLGAYFSYLDIPKEMFPPTSLNKVLISGRYGSSSNEALDKLIVQDCESILQEHHAISNISSVISSGTYQITADIAEGSKKELVITEIENEMKALEDDLPSDFTLPTLRSVEQFFPLMSIALFSKDSAEDEIVETAKSLNDEIKNLEHIYQSQLIGGYDQTIRLSIDDRVLQAYAIPRDEVYSQIMSLYSIFPIGDITSQNDKYFITTKTSGISLDDILDSQIRVDNKVIYLRDIAKVQYRYEKHALLTKTDGEPSLIIHTKKAKMGDSIELSKEIRQIIKRYESEHGDIAFKVLNDSSFWIKTRLNVISSNIIIGLILLFFAIWAFLSLKIALVVIIGIPVSFAFGVIGLDVLDFSFNTLSMIGVLLSLGMLVDEAIVVSENIHRHKMMGKNSYEACLDGTYEVLPVLFASMLTTIIAFLPLTTLSGGLGLFIQIIPIMVIILIVSSFLESFLFLPLHYFFLDQKSKSIPALKEIKERAWQKANRLYGDILRFLFQKKFLWLSLFVSTTLIFSSIVIAASKFQLFPEFDAMSINITGKSAHNSTRYTNAQTEIIEQVLLQNLDRNNIASIHTTVGMNSDGRGKHDKGKNLFTITLNLHPKTPEDFFNRVINPFFKLFGDNKEEATRELSAKAIKKKVEKLFAEDERFKSFLQLGISIPQTGVVESDVAILVSHKDDAKIKKTIDQLKKEMSQIEGVYAVGDDMRFDNIDMQLELGGYAKTLGFTQSQIIQSLRNYIEVDKISKVIDSRGEFVEIKTDFLGKNDLEALKNLHLRIPESQQFVVLEDIAKISYSAKATTLKKDDGQKVYTVHASLDKKRITSRAFHKKMRPVLDEIEAENISITIKGEAQKNSQIKKDIAKSMLFALFGILLVLTWVFGSFRLSLFALTSIVLSLPGVLAGHQIMGINLTFSSLLGMVGLIGVVVNDTALMLSFIKKAKNSEEIISWATFRVKPILLTSITTMLGLSTLIFFASGESLLMQPLAVSIGFGLLWATVVNLFYVPLGYALGTSRKIPNRVRSEGK